MANAVYEPESEERNRHRPGRGHDRASGDASDPRGERTASGNASDPRGEGPDSLDSIRQNEAEGAGGKPSFNISSTGGAKSWDGGFPGNKASASELNNKESSDSSADDDHFWDHAADPSTNRGLKARFRVNRRRIAIGGVIATVTVTGTAGWLSIVQGPGQLVQLGELLKNPLSGQNDDSSGRLKRLLRFARSGEYGETRLTKLGSITFNDTLTKLNDIGINLQTGSISQLRSATIDTNKLAERYPELKGVSTDEARAKLTELFPSLSEDQLVRIGSGSGVSGTKFAVNARDFGPEATRALLDNSMSHLDNGKILTGIRGRATAKFFNVGNLWHPLQKKISEKQNQYATKADRKKAEAEREKALKATESGKFQAARDHLKSKLEGNEGKLSGALLITAGMCIIRSVADDVPAVNRGAVIVPAEIKTLDKVAGASQVQANDDTGMAAVSQMVASFTDDQGHSIWEAQGINALQDPSDAKGSEMPSEFKQAYSSDATAKTLKDTLGGGGFGALACSTPGQIIQIAGGLALIVAGPLSGGASWGLVAAKAGAGVAVTAGVTTLLHNEAVNLLKNDAAIPDVLSGPLGGNIMAYSAREFEGITARSSGGVALGPADEAAIVSKQQLASKQEFHNKSFFSQIFDKNDYRSVSSQVAMSISPNMGNNIASIASSIFNLGGLISHFSSLFMPKTSAATTYDWGFPIYGLPKQITNDSDFDNPYDNADKVASLLDSDGGEDSGYVKRAMNCFGVKVSKGDDGWQAVADEDVNPNDADYIGADCANLSDKNWERMIMFVFDSRTADAVDCYQGGYETSDQSCKNVAFGGAAAATDSTGADADPTTDPGVTVDTANLYKDSTSVKCAEGTKDLGVQDGYTNGQKVRIRICAVSNLPGTGQESSGGFGVSGADGKTVVNSRVSGAVYAMADAAKKDGIDLQTSSAFRTMAHQQSLCPCDGVTVARPGYSNHQMGLALDFGAFLPSTPGPISGNKYWEWLSKNADNFSYKNYPREAWHWSPTGN